MIWVVFVCAVAALVLAVAALITREAARAREDAEAIKRYWKAREADAGAAFCWGDSEPYRPEEPEKEKA